MLTGDKGGKKFGQVMIFYESLYDYLSVMPKTRPTHRRDYSHTHFHKSSSLRTDMDDEISENDVLNSSMIQIVNDYIDQCEYQATEKIKKLHGNEYYVPKALIFISDLPIFDVMKEMLITLYKQCTYRINFPIDAYFYYLTYEAPLPSLGTKVTYSLSNMKEIEVTDNNFNVEYLTKYFSNPLLSFSNFYKTLYWFLCQVGNTLLISKDVSKLVMVSEVLRTIIYPFTYDDPYIPLLAPNMIKSIEAPFP